MDSDSASNFSVGACPRGECSKPKDVSVVDVAFAFAFDLQFWHFWQPVPARRGFRRFWQSLLAHSGLFPFLLLRASVSPCLRGGCWFLIRIVRFDSRLRFCCWFWFANCQLPITNCSPKPVTLVSHGGFHPCPDTGLSALSSYWPRCLYRQRLIS